MDCMAQLSPYPGMSHWMQPKLLLPSDVSVLSIQKLLKLFNQEDFISTNILEMVFHHSPIPGIVDTEVRALL